MSFVIHRSTYYNTSGDEVTWKIDIIDTDVDAGQTINFETDRSPEIRYSGLPQDLKPGIYPTSVTFRMAIRSLTVVKHDVTMGPNFGFITDLAAAAEGRYLVKVYKDDVLIFIGAIRPGEASYEDGAEPYYLTLEAEDGLYRLSSEEYVSEVGQIEYITLSAQDDDGGTEFSSTPLSAGLVGTEWILIEHYSELRAHFNPTGLHSSRRSTYARYEQYSVLSPGTGWVDQGGSLWALELDYFNEVIVDEDETYHLTRDIDNTPFRPLSEYISRAFELMPTKDEYLTDCMYDICNRWYETGMWVLTGDPFTMVRWSEKKFAVGKKWSDVISEILRHFYCRLYYSDGRYHIEQISERGELTITRHCYNNAGTFIETEENVDLDLSYYDLEIKTETGGTFKSLAPLKKVQIKVSLGSNNLLEEQEWDYGHQGSRYLGRLKKIEADTRFYIVIDTSLGALWSAGVLNGLPDIMQIGSTSLRATWNLRCRVTNIETGTTYHLTPTSQESFSESTWETDPIAGYFERSFTMQGITLPQTDTSNSINFKTLTDDLPGNTNDSFDVYLSMTLTLSFAIPELGTLWTVNNTTEYEFIFNPFFKSMTTVDVDKEPVNSNQEKVYEVVNNVNNSLTVEMQAKFCDTGMGDDSIEILSSASPISWRKSRSWNRDGIVSGSVELLQLLAQEIMSLRLLPRRVYSGGFLTSLMSVQNRINRDSYYYLPLSVSIDTDMDKISGEFVHLEREDPGTADVIEIPYEGELIPGITSAEDVTDPVLPLVFVTNEIINDTDNLTEIDILNTYGQYVGSGETVTILNLATGQQENVTLTQAVEPDDTTMFFNAHVFLYDFPVGSPILIFTEDGLTPESLNEYKFSEYNYSSADHYASTYNFPNPEGNTQTAIDRRINIWRNGNKMVYRSVAAGPAEYSINYAAKKFTFPIAFSGEYIQIHAK